MLTNNSNNFSKSKTGDQRELSIKMGLANKPKRIVSINQENDKA